MKTTSTYKYHEGKYLVAFIDVLGAKEIISQNSEDALNDIFVKFSTKDTILLENDLPDVEA